MDELESRHRYKSDMTLPKHVFTAKFQCTHQVSICESCCLKIAHRRHSLESPPNKTRESLLTTLLRHTLDVLLGTGIDDIFLLQSTTPHHTTYTTHQNSGKPNISKISKTQQSKIRTRMTAAEHSTHRILIRLDVFPDCHLSTYVLALSTP